ncbi:hypothetical protein [Motilimonas pumila]|uniref:Uncharacterized protein n=1 Tax=Motilimonas pumila TaxID=2303987 RepID=A0A418YHW3_9GAMM|nr:hypothetical protein [Motilimonas pumila]RJG49919.1 hypothetical protein D1Z90_04555 [Motilimonas pumila]
MNKTLGVIACSMLTSSVYAKQVETPFTAMFTTGEVVSGVLSYDDAARMDQSDQYSAFFKDSSAGSYIEVQLGGETYRAQASDMQPLEIHVHTGMGDGRRDIIFNPNQSLISQAGVSIGGMDIIVSDADGARSQLQLPSAIDINPVTGPERFNPGNDWAELYFMNRSPDNIAEISEIGSSVSDTGKVSYQFEAVVEFAQQPPFIQNQIGKGTITWEKHLPKVNQYGETGVEYADYSPEITFTVGDYTYQVDPNLMDDKVTLGVHGTPEGLLQGVHMHYTYPLQGVDSQGMPAPELLDFSLDIFIPQPNQTTDLSVPSQLPVLTPDVDARIHTQAGALKLVSLENVSDFVTAEPKVFIEVFTDFPDTNLVVPAKGGKVVFARDVMFKQPPMPATPDETFTIRYGENITWPNGFVYNRTGSKKVDLFKAPVNAPLSFYVPKHWPAGKYEYNMYSYEVDTGAVATKTITFTKLK